MSDGERTLDRCFRATFPDTAPEAIAAASIDTLPEWDSLHTLILIAVLEEQFRIRIPTDDYPVLRSFAAVHEYLRSAGRL